MQITMLKSKLHCATVTEANLNYMGSITIDEALMDAAGLLDGEMVHVVNNNNGERIVTYIIKGERDSGVICLNGAAARKFQPGDTVFTSGYSSIFPPDIPLGTIGKSKIVNGATYEIDVELFEDFGALRYVVVVENLGKDEMKELEGY